MKKKAAALCMAFAMMCGVGATVYAENTDMPDELAYVYVDEAETPVSEGQNIVVSFENENLAVASARLQYQIEENTGGEIEASQILHNTLLFVQQYDSEAEAGNYSLTGLSYTLEDGTEKQIDFTSQEIAASYQVLADEAMEIQDLDSTEEVSVYSMNDDGAIVQETGDSAEQTIGTVLEEARAVEPASSLLRTGRREVVVAIGAGHDSRHVGARSEDGRLREESLNLKVAKYCQEELSKYTGVRVVMLRDKESCPYNNATLSYCLNQRVIDAANAGAQLYVDLHFNAGGGNGAEVYYPNKSWRPHLSEEGEDVSVKILNQLEALGLANRGAKIKNTTLAGEDGEYPDGSKSDYFTTNVVAKELGITGIIVEHAFLDGAQDVSRLRDEAFLKQLGVADAVGIARKYGLTRVESAGDTADGAENGGNPPENSVPGNTEEDSAQYLANFYDVKVGDWYYDYAKYVYEEGLMTGLNNETFGPADSLGRGQLVTILYRMMGEPEVEYKKKFADVADGMFYSEPVIWASENEIVTGYTNGNFGPADDITREQLALMVYRYAKANGKDVSNRADLGRFPDAGYVSGFAKEAVEWSVAEGIISGDNDKINPQGNASRAHCAAIMMRFIEKYGK